MNNNRTEVAENSLSMK